MIEAHEDHRRQLAEDVDPRCETCEPYGQRLDALRRSLAELGPGSAPAGLVDRTLDAVHGPPFRPGLVGPRVLVRTLTERGSRRHRAGGAGAGLRAVGRVRGDLLLAAATATEGAGSARLHVSGTAEVVLPRDGAAAPRFDTAPDEVAGYLARTWASMQMEVERRQAEAERHAADAERRAARAEAEAEAAAAQAQAEADASVAAQQPPPDRTQTPPRQGPLRPPNSDRPPSPPPLPAPPTAPRTPADPLATPPPSLPDRASIGITVSAEGAAAFSGRPRLSLTGTARPVSGTVPAPATSATFEVRAAGTAPVLRTADGDWTRVARTDTTPWAALLARPDGIVDLLRSAQPGARVAGRADGLRHVRTSVDGRAVDVWIDAQQRPRRITVTSAAGSGAGKAWTSSVTVELRDFGTAVPDVQAPAAAADAEGTSSFLYPLGPAVASTLKAGS